MKYYVYISDAKVGMLFPQLELGHNERQRKAKFGFNFGLLNGGVEEEKKLTTQAYEKIEKIVDELRRSDQIGDIDSRKPFIHATMELEWVNFGGSNKNSPLSYWVGCSNATLVSLAGSKCHVIGKETTDGIAGYSSLLPDVEYWLREQLSEMSDQEYSQIVVSESYKHRRYHVKSETISEVVLRSKYERNRRIGEPKEFEFVARVLHEDFDADLRFGESRANNIVLATPLYVALC